MYQQALGLRPNYVRTLANIGLGYNSMGEYEQAIPYFLNALILNKDAHHIWKYLERAVSLSGKQDLLDKIQHRNPDMFRSDYKLISVEELPKHGKILVDEIS